VPESAIYSLVQWPKHLAVVQTTLLVCINDSNIYTKCTSAIGLRKGMLKENSVPK